jgi:hypothetical protein
MRVTAVCSLTLALIGSAGRAVADERQVCVSAAELAQRQKSSGKLREERASLLQCARSVCPAIVRTDCTRWLSENEAALPTLVFHVQDERGRDLSDVHVLFDGAPLATRLEGLPLAVDPGEHWLTFERQGSFALRRQMVIQTGEKNRLVTVMLEDSEPLKSSYERSPAAPPPVVPPPLPPASTRAHPAAWALAGISLGALASFAYFGLTGQADVRRLRETCAGHCSAAQVDVARNKLLVADISLASAIVTGTIATMLLLGSAKADSARPSAGLSVAPLAGGAFAGWVERF